MYLSRSHALSNSSKAQNSFSSIISKSRWLRKLLSSGMLWAFRQESTRHPKKLTHLWFGIIMAYIYIIVYI